MQLLFKVEKMFKIGLVLFVLSIYQYALIQSPWIKLLPALSLSLTVEPGWHRSSLVLAGVADFFFDLEPTWMFGLLLFFCCQLTLILGTPGRISLHNYPKSCLGVLAAGAGLYFLLSYSAVPITFYALLLLQLLIMVLPQAHSLYGSGCLLFIGSDLLVLIEMILKHTQQAVVPLRVLPTIGLPLYWGALLLIALSHKPTIQPSRELAR